VDETMNNWKFRLHGFLALIALILAFTAPAFAQTSSPFSNLQAEQNFGEFIRFSAEIDSGTEFSSIDLVFKSISTGNSTVISADLGSDSLVTAIYRIQSQDYIPAFSTIEYWFNIKFEDGTQNQSQKERFVYQDNRFTWQNLESNDPYKIFWVEGDLAFGQAIQDALYQSIENFSNEIDLPIPETLSVYIYPTASSLQSALDITNARWIAGHANPAENIILASIPLSFEQNLVIKRQIPHELTHIRLFLYLEDNYANLPAWYSEGLASLSELDSIPEYWEILQAAWQNDEMIPISELCASIPTEVDRAALAYAEADSFVRFLSNEYGKVGLQDLLDAYKQGHTCENGIQTIFNLELEDLEKDWYQNTFNSSIIPQSLSAAITWGVLLLLLFATPLGLIIISSLKKSQKGDRHE
jgi:hypothetical protein